MAIIKEEQDKDLSPHFVKIIPYSKEPHLTDVLIGQKGSLAHGHLTLSGGGFHFARQENDVVLVKDGSVLSTNTFPTKILTCPKCGSSTGYFISESFPLNCSTCGTPMA